jgi:hypothetical protein
MIWIEIEINISYAVHSQSLLIYITCEKRVKPLW